MRAIFFILILTLASCAPLIECDNGEVYPGTLEFTQYGTWYCLDCDQYRYAIMTKEKDGSILVKTKVRTSSKYEQYWFRNRKSASTFIHALAEASNCLPLMKEFELSRKKKKK